MARRFRVEGTKDFLYAAILIGALGTWAVRDGWFPSKKVLERHPRNLPVAFETGGIVAEIRVAPGDEVKPAQPMVILQRSELESRVNALERNLKTLQDEIALAGAGGPALAERRATERARWTAELAEARTAMVARELQSPTNGYVTAVRVERNGVARPRVPVVDILVKDHFYAFNKSLAFLCGIAAVACLVIHFKVR